MNPWWKRPSSESASSESRARHGERDNRSSDSDGNDGGGGRGRRRRRGRRGGQSSNEQQAQERKQSGRPRSRRGGRRRRRGRRAMGHTVVLVDVDALHKAVKAAGGQPEEAGDLFSNVQPGDHVSLRAIACAGRKRKVQKALETCGFEVQQVEGGTEAARVQLALDALEVAIGTDRVEIHCLPVSPVLEQRLRAHGAEVRPFSLDDPPTVGPAPKDDSAAEAAADRSDGDEEAQDADDSESAPSEASSKGRRRRRRGRGRRDGEAREAEAQAESSEPSEAAEPVDPLQLLGAAIGRLAEGERQLVWATKVRREMSRIEPRFNETDHGYEDFEALLREAERRGRVALQKDPRTSTFVIVGWRAA